MKRMNILLSVVAVAGLAIAVTFAQDSTKPAAGGGTSGPAAAGASGVVKDSWDWASEMAKVAKNFKGTQGVVLHMGDSITYANQATAWGRSGCSGGTAEDQAIAKWSHCGEKNDKDGWYLASVDAASGRSQTAENSITTEGYLNGKGKYGLPSLEDLIKKYNPQVAFVLLGTNDVSKNRKPEDAAKDMGKILDALMANGTIPVLLTVPARTDGEAKMETTKKVNELYVALAKEKKVPLIDLCGEMLARQPMDKMKETLVSKDNIHLTGKNAGGPPTPENLASSGYLLRCYLVVKKLQEVKAKAIR